MLRLLEPNIISYFPIITNSTGVTAHNVLFTTIPTSAYLLRNQGIFWEPGAYQTFLNFALIFVLFIDVENIQRKTLILTCAILTTLSTTGYLVALLIFMAYIIDLLLSKKEANNRKYKYLLLAIISLIIGVVIFINLPDKARYQLFGKVSNYLSSDIHNSTTRSSTSVRVDAFIYAIKAFFASPIFGIGYTDLENLAIREGFLMWTATPANWLAVFGFIPGLVLNVGLVKLALNLSDKWIVKFILVVSIFLTIIAEEYSRNPSILIFCLYGYNMSKLHNLKSFVYWVLRLQSAPPSKLV